MPRIIFGGWTPDQPDFLAQGLQIARNVYPAPLGCRPVNSFVPLKTALPLACKGAASFVAPNGSTVVLAGTVSSLYKSNGLGWSGIGAGYTVASDSRWRFVQFGGIAIATNGTDPMVKINLDGVGGLTLLGGDPPTTKLLAVVKDFVVGGVINGDVRTIQWSGINDAEFWTPAQNQSDYQIMPTGGEVTGILGGDVGIILQRNRIVRMTYVGGNTIFDFDEVSYNVGCVSRHSVAQAGAFGFFLSDNGFMMWDGAALKPIGFERVDRTFASNYSRANWGEMSTAVDARNNLVCWSMGSEIYVYNWALDRWSIIRQAAQVIFSGFTRAMTLEEVATIFPNIDTMNVPLDSDVFQEGNPALFLFNEDNEMGAFRGALMESEIELPQQELASGRSSRVNEVRPLTDATAGLSLAVEARDRLGDETTPTEYNYLTPSGRVPVRESGHYLKVALRFAAGADWSYAQGLEVGIAGGLAAGGRR
jgi:hypothetical protein